ncbi:MAG: DNA-directed RNA polymerase [Candidatus Micrarchaeia archaeon]
MYKIYYVRDTFQFEPHNFGRPIEEVAEEVLKNKYEGSIDKDMGIIVGIFDIKNISDGIIYPNDPASYHTVDFSVLAYLPIINEFIAGPITDMADFGIFVRLGPLEGLVHVSQITNEFISYNHKLSTFVSKQSKKTLKQGDIVYAKISTISMKNSIKDSKIALTMRSEGLGKPEWLTQIFSSADKALPQARSKPQKAAQKTQHAKK